MKAGFIGLGTMGASMALNVRAAGFDLVVNDIRREASVPHVKAGPTWSDSARAVADAADVVFTSLPRPREVEAVAPAEDGLLAGMRRGTAWFELSTNSPSVVRRLHERFAAQGVSMLNSPVSGGPAGAKSRSLALWVSGDKAAFDRYKTVLDAIGDHPMYVGPIGVGTVAKLVHEELTEGIHRGWAERDSRIFMLLQEERAGVEIAAPPEEVRKVLTDG